MVILVYSVYGSANPKSTKALRWAAMQENSIASPDVTTQGCEEHDAQLFLTMSLQCKGGTLVTVKNIPVNSGHEAWRALNATYLSSE